MSIVSRTPVGYRFRPTDEVIINHYLIPKIEGRPLPSNHIYETAEIYGEEDLGTTFQKGIQHYSQYASFNEHCDDSLFFFTKLKKKWHNCGRICRTAGDGTWKEDNGKDIYRDESYKVRKTNLTFTVNGKRKIQTRDGYVTWNMEEYSIQKDEINLDYAIVKIKKKISKAVDVAVQGGHDVAVLPEQPAAADNKMQYQLPIAGQYLPSTNFQSAMDNVAAFEPWLNAVLPAAEDNYLQYQPSTSTVESANVDSSTTSPEFWGNCQLEPFPCSLVHQEAVFPCQQQLESCGDPLYYNIPNYQVDSYSFYQYPLPPHETVVPPLAIGGDNAAVEDHNRECSNDALVANSEVEAVQPQNISEGHF